MKNFDRQIAAIRHLEIPPRRDVCTLIEFKVEEIRDVYFVVRTWTPNHARSIEYTDATVVGPRGGLDRKYTSNNI